MIWRCGGRRMVSYQLLILVAAQLCRIGDNIRMWGALPRRLEVGQKGRKSFGFIEISLAFAGQTYSQGCSIEEANTQPIFKPCKSPAHG